MKHNQTQLALEEKVFEFCQQESLFAPHNHKEIPLIVCVALSGGADSMTLLRMLLVLAPRLSIAVTACHVNHCLRGDAADADELFVRAACKMLHVPLTVYHAIADGYIPPVPAGETWARDLRHRYFANLLEKQNVFMATAHTLNDQAETLLFRLARGTGVHGATGIRPKRNRYVRPILCLSRTEVEQYCHIIGQAYVTDETNQETYYARNHLRAHAIPSLCYANRSAVQHIGQFCHKMVAVDQYLTKQATNLLSHASTIAQQMIHENDAMTKEEYDATQNDCWSLAILSEADSLILETAMYRLIASLRDAEQKYIVALCELVHTGHGALQITSQARFMILADVLFLEQSVKEIIKQPQSVEYYPISMGKYDFPGGYSVRLEKITLKNMEKIHLVHKKDLKNCADYDKIVSSVRLRTRQSGDIFTPIGRGCTKTLKKLHNEIGLPAHVRGQLPLIADGNTVVWHWGQGFAEGFAPTEDSTFILRITEEQSGG